MSEYEQTILLLMYLVIPRFYFSYSIVSRTHLAYYLVQLNDVELVSRETWAYVEPLATLLYSPPLHLGLDSTGFGLGEEVESCLHHHPYAMIGPLLLPSVLFTELLFFSDLTASVHSILCNCTHHRCRLHGVWKIPSYCRSHLYRTASSNVFIMAYCNSALLDYLYCWHYIKTFIILTICDRFHCCINLAWTLSVIETNGMFVFLIKL